MNRVSAGRAAAAAYIGVNTVVPGLAARETKSAVKLSSTLLEENVRYRTEPSLLRRARASDTFEEGQLVAAGLPSGRRRRRDRSERPPVIALVGVLALLVGALSVLVAHYQVHPSSEAVLWEHGIDGQPGYLDVPATRAPASDEVPLPGNVLLEPQVVEAPWRGGVASAPVPFLAPGHLGGPVREGEQPASGPGLRGAEAGPAPQAEVAQAVAPAPVQTAPAPPSVAVGPSTRATPKLSRGSRGRPAEDPGSSGQAKSVLPSSSPEPAEQEEPWLE